MQKFEDSRKKLLERIDQLYGIADKIQDFIENLPESMADVSCYACENKPEIIKTCLGCNKRGKLPYHFLTFLEDRAFTPLKEMNEGNFTAIEEVESLICGEQNREDIMSRPSHQNNGQMLLHC